MKFAALSVWIVFSACLVFAQDIQVNQQNKTIAVTADESITADAEIAVIAIGYQNYAPDHEVAFQENVRVSNLIAKTLLDSGIPKENIETRKLSFARVEQDEKAPDRQFEVQQSWHVIVPASRAQDIVNLAVKSGANEVEDVEWNVDDPVALQAKASSVALAKAHEVAGQMAKELGAKLGELVYASNRISVNKSWRRVVNTASESTETYAFKVKQQNNKPELILFPQKVKSDATVYAVFAIE